MECCLKKRILSIGNSLPIFSINGLDKNNNIITINNDFIKDKKIIFFFYPLDFTFVCPTEINALSEIYEELAHHNTLLISISTDSVYTHKEWKKQLSNINFIMGSDLSRNFSQKLGVLNDQGVCSRVTYLIDEKGIIQWMEISPDSIGRDPKNILKIIHGLNTGGLCPANWVKGHELIKIN